MGRIERKSSIENEPRTLYMDEIQYAREVAKYVVNTKSTKEALTIFTQGLVPVVSAATAAVRRDRYGDRLMVNLGEEEADDDDDDDGVSDLIHRRIIPRVTKDIASAPF